MLNRVFNWMLTAEIADIVAAVSISVDSQATL